MAKSHKELKPSDIVAIVDNREQRPWSLSPLKTMRGTLSTGDYSVLGLSEPPYGICIERKSLFDLLGVIGTHRDRFENELDRMRAYRTSAVIVEATFAEFSAGRWQEKGVYPWVSRIKPEAAMGSVLGWIAEGIPILFAGDASSASICAARILFIAARRRYNELQSFYGDGLKISS